MTVPSPARVAEIEAALAKAGPRTFRCCPHCADDEIHDVPKDGHDLPCDICTERRATDALPELLATVREQADAIQRARALADELAELGELNMARADEHHAAGREVDEHYRLGRSISYTQTADRLRAVLPADHGQEERDE